MKGTELTLFTVAMKTAQFFITHRMCYCKVAGSNLTCRDDWKTRWRLHSVGLTSTGLFSPSQNIIHSPVARVVYG